MRPYVYIWLVGLLLLLAKTQTHWLDSDEEDLFTAINAGDYTQARQILAAGGIDIKARNPRNLTFLHLSNDPVLSQQLIALGGDVIAGEGGRDRIFRYIPSVKTGIGKIDRAIYDIKNKSAELKPLHTISHVEVAKLLIDAGADVNAKDGYGRSPLYRNATKADWVSLLLERGADVNSVDEFGNNVAMEAVNRIYRGEDWSAIRLLVDAGANLTHQDSLGYTVLHNLRLGNAGLAKYLVDAGADVNTASHSGDLPICMALANNAKNLIVFFMIRGKGILSRCSDNRDIFEYAKQESTSSTQQVLTKGAAIILREYNKHQQKINKQK